jgi:hypothetical protein
MIIVKRTYTPVPGASGLDKLLEQVSQETIAAGMPEVKVFRKYLGYHGVMVTMQEWNTMEEYNDSRNQVRQTPDIRKIFENIYPLLSETHKTEIFESVT